MLLVGLGNPRQCSDVLAVLVRKFFEFVDVPKGEFQIHGQCFDSFVDRHSVTFSVASSLESLARGEALGERAISSAN